jgi:hypothetical protein
LVAERFFSSRKQLFREASFRQKKDPLDRILGYIDFLIEMSRDPRAEKGCLLGTFAQELSETHPQIRSVCAACFGEQAEFLKEDQRLHQVAARISLGARIDRPNRKH